LYRFENGLIVEFQVLVANELPVDNLDHTCR